MNKTANYQLSQWVKTDKVQMEDFNADNAKIDAALKAETDARTALAATVSTQNATLSDHTASLALLGNCAVYTSTYHGNGETSRSLSFPGYPVFVFLQLMSYPANVIFIRNAGCGAGDYGNVWMRPAWSDREMSWNMADGSTALMNSKGSSYAVFALLDMSK